jgi:hypothetical protein
VPGKMPVLEERLCSASRLKPRHGVAVQAGEKAALYQGTTLVGP